MEYIIEVENLTKKFGHRTVLNNINMHIRPGEIYGFIGRNGAGKTTAMRIILGLTPMNSGRIRLFGGDNLASARRCIGSLIEAPGIYNNCTAYENMKRFSIIYGGSDADIRNLLSMVGLGNTGNKKAGQFSLGMKQRLGIALSLLGGPSILILDEPINGLDPAGIKEIRDIILNINRQFGVTFLISSHLLDELSKVVTTYGIINNGVMIEETPANVLAERCKQTVNLATGADPGQVADFLCNNGLIHNYGFSNGYIQIYDQNTNIPAIVRSLTSQNIDIYEVAHVNSGLEDYFIQRL
ncbi:MAG: ABC transporter ATP-binding protein [Eubacteriales bacterium]|nr:ABC transporter ATP-binding protein [Eubacteriales bacterium]